ncbi:hypothetical protein Tco_0285184 [Tanacetum coccineum]
MVSSGGAFVVSSGGGESRPEFVRRARPDLLGCLVGRCLARLGFVRWWALSSSRGGFMELVRSYWVIRLGVDAELKTLIATYDIPLDLRPRLPDSNFRMSILPAGDTAIAMSIHDFLCMPSLENATVREKPHELGTSILSRVADHTTPPAPAGTALPRASLEEIAVTRPDRNVVAKADYAAKQKTSTGPEISTNTTKRTRLSQKVSGAGSSGLAAGDKVEQTDDGTLDDDDQRDGLEFAVEDVRNLNDVGQDKEVKAHTELSGGVLTGQPLDIGAGADEVASDGHVDSYFDARVSNTAGDVIKRRGRDLSFLRRGPYYLALSLWGK